MSEVPSEPTGSCKLEASPSNSQARLSERMMARLGFDEVPSSNSQGLHLLAIFL
jgi:hypothetical protein